MSLWTVTLVLLFLDNRKCQLLDPQTRQRQGESFSLPVFLFFSEASFELFLHLQPTVIHGLLLFQTRRPTPMPTCTARRRTARTRWWASTRRRSAAPRALGGLPGWWAASRRQQPSAGRAGTTSTAPWAPNTPATAVKPLPMTVGVCRSRSGWRGRTRILQHTHIKKKPQQQNLSIREISASLLLCLTGVDGSSPRFPPAFPTKCLIAPQDVACRTSLIVCRNLLPLFISALSRSQKYRLLPHPQPNSANNSRTLTHTVSWSTEVIKAQLPLSALSVGVLWNSQLSA